MQGLAVWLFDAVLDIDRFQIGVANFSPDCFGKVSVFGEFGRFGLRDHPCAREDARPILTHDTLDGKHCHRIVALYLSLHEDIVDTLHQRLSRISGMSLRLARQL